MRYTIKIYSISSLSECIHKANNRSQNAFLRKKTTKSKSVIRPLGGSFHFLIHFSTACTLLSNDRVGLNEIKKNASVVAVTTEALLSYFTTLLIKLNVFLCRFISKYPYLHNTWHQHCWDLLQLHFRPIRQD